MTTYSTNEKIRNIAIIAHVDHGKTTLVDFMIKQSGVYREQEMVPDRVMDSMDLERERGITISAKNCSVFFGDLKINIIDTPGHADFGGEVERALIMVDGAILLVDASEGPLPQTRFVLKKALERDLKIIVCINKIDRADARPQAVLNEIYDLFIDLDARDDQIEFPVLYTIGRQGIALNSLDETGEGLHKLFEAIRDNIPAPKYDPSKPFQMLVANLGYSDYVGRLAIGRIVNGQVKARDALVCIGPNDKQTNLKVVKLQCYQGVRIADADQVLPGDIAIVAGVEDVQIGDTICTAQQPIALPRIHVDEPTVSMTFTGNTSPLAGREGKIVQGKKISDRLKKETLHNVGLQMDESKNMDTFVVKGRGEFQLAILIETMRREGFELTVGRPQIIFKYDGDKKLEPIEHVLIDCDEVNIGIITEKLSARKGQLCNMVNHGSGRVRLEFKIPSRGLIGYRSQFMTDTRGTGIMNSYLEGYEEYRGDFPSRKTGSLVADRPGSAIPYAIFHLEPRGKLLVQPGDEVYEGMVVGEHTRENDLDVNICKEKKLSNMRAAGKDENILLTPVTPMTLEKAIEFIAEDELIEVTPKNVRLRKSVLDAIKR